MDCSHTTSGQIYLDDGEEVNVEVGFEYCPGHPGSFWEPPSGPEIEIHEIIPYFEKPNAVDLLAGWKEKRKMIEKYIENNFDNLAENLECACEDYISDTVG